MFSSVSTEKKQIILVHMFSILFGKHELEAWWGVFPERAGPEGFE